MLIKMKHLTWYKFYTLRSSGWDDPVEISERPDENPARYLLNGEFKNHCDGKNIFDDSVMKTINKDIANRSLMILKYIILA